VPQKMLTSGENHTALAITATLKSFRRGRTVPLVGIGVGIWVAGSRRREEGRRMSDDSGGHSLVVVRGRGTRIRGRRRQVHVKNRKAKQGRNSHLLVISSCLTYQIPSYPMSRGVSISAVSVFFLFPLFSTIRVRLYLAVIPDAAKN
jgi:hypothetical protein